MLAKQPDWASQAPLYTAVHQGVLQPFGALIAVVNELSMTAKRMAQQQNHSRRHEERENAESENVKEPPMSTPASIPRNQTDWSGAYRTCPTQTASRSATATGWASELAGSAITGSLFGGAAALRKGLGFSFERARHRAYFERVAGQRIYQTIRSESVEDLLTTALTRDQASVLQYGKVPRHRGCRHFKSRGEVGRRHFGF